MNTYVKRAGFNIGIGRELYTRILYFASVPTKQTGTDKNGKPIYKMENPYEKFTVAEITTNEETEKIEKIKIADSAGKIVFSYGYPKVQSAKLKTEDKPVEMITPAQVTKLHTLLSKIDNEDFKKQLYDKFKVTTSKELTKVNAITMIDFLEKKLGE